MLKPLMPAITIVCIITGFCSCSAGSVEPKIKGYVKDSMVPKLNDPSSFELVSVGKPDTITDHTLSDMELTFDNDLIKSSQSHLDIVALDTAQSENARFEYGLYKHDIDSMKAEADSITKVL